MKLFFVFVCCLSSVPRQGQSFGFSLDSDEREEESSGKARPTDDLKERKERPEEVQRPSWEKKTLADDRWKRREDSEPRLYGACDDSQEPPDGTDKSGRSVNLGLILTSQQGLTSFYFIFFLTPDVTCLKLKCSKYYKI